MATWTDRIRLLFDADTGAAERGFRSIAKSIREAEGFGGKIKAAGAGLKDWVNTAAGATTVTLAVGAAMLKSAMDAEKLALEVDKLANATGLSSEAASRWIEVGNDLGLSTDQIGGLIEKMTKNLGATPAYFERMGISVKHAKDGTVDMNATLVDALARISAIEDPTKRAALAQKLFGRSWADAAELVNMSAGELQKRLAAVDAGHIMTDADRARARAFRDAMDRLQDSLKSVELTIGKAIIPELKTMADTLGPVTEMVSGLVSALDSNSFGRGAKKLAELSDPLGMLSEAAKAARGDLTGLAMDLGVGSFQKLPPAVQAATDKISAFQAVMNLGNVAMGAMSGAMDGVIDKAKALHTKWEELRSSFTDRTAFDDASLSLLGLQRKIKEIVDRTKPGGDLSPAEGWLEVDKVINETRAGVGGYMEDILHLPASKMTEINALIDQGKYDEAQRMLDALTKQRTAEIAVRTFIGNPKPGGSGGGPVTGVGNTSHVNITINAHPTNQPAELGRVVAGALKAYLATGGERP